MWEKGEGSTSCCHSQQGNEGVHAFGVGFEMDVANDGVEIVEL